MTEFSYHQDGPSRVTLNSVDSAAAAAAAATGCRRGHIIGAATAALTPHLSSSIFF